MSILRRTALNMLSLSANLTAALVLLATTRGA